MRRLLFLPASALVLCACSSGTPAAAPTAPAPVTVTVTATPPAKTTVIAPAKTVTVTYTPTPAEDELIQDGVWVVGDDIKAGTYRTIETVGEDCYLEDHPVRNKRGRHHQQRHPRRRPPTGDPPEGPGLRHPRLWGLGARVDPATPSTHHRDVDHTLGVYTPGVYTPTVEVCTHRVSNRREGSAVLKAQIVPNQPRTPTRTLRVPDDLWREATRIARDRGETLSDVMRDSLVRYVEEHSPSASPSQPSPD